MQITNNANLPEAIVNAVRNDPYDAGACDISVTKLIGPPQIRVLEREHAEELTEDASDRIWSLIGQIGHGILERAEFTTSPSAALFAGIAGWRLSAASSTTWLLPDGTLQDYKFTSGLGRRRRASSPSGKRSSTSCAGSPPRTATHLSAVCKASPSCATGPEARPARVTRTRRIKSRSSRCRSGIWTPPASTSPRALTCTSSPTNAPPTATRCRSAPSRALGQAHPTRCASPGARAPSSSTTTKMTPWPTAPRSPAATSSIGPVNRYAAPSTAPLPGSAPSAKPSLPSVKKRKPKRPKHAPE